jgi:O-acetyl-ADP-ribose deacetylase (regulator of RNase III)
MNLSQSKINYKRGNLFEFISEYDAIAHGVNCLGVMSAGFAKQFKAKFPLSFTAYRKLCLSRYSNDLVGTNQLACNYSGTDVWNLFTQETYGPGMRISYDAINSCFDKFFSYYELLDRPVLIAIPKIGAGLGGGDWSKIEEIIKENLKKYPNIELTVFEL